MKKALAIGLVLALSIGTITAFADSPQEILSNVSGLSLGDIQEERDMGKRLEEIAEEKGVTDEFNAGLLGEAEERLSQAVEDERITQDEADEILARLSERIESGYYGIPKGQGRMGIRGERPEQDRILDATQMEAFEAEMEGVREEIIAKIEDEGLITQELAAEINQIMDRQEASRQDNPGERPERIDFRALAGEEAVNRFKELLENEKQNAVEKLVSEGVITEEQASELAERAALRQERREGMREGFDGGFGNQEGFEERTMREAGRNDSNRQFNRGFGIF